jgi:hypothetical protein
MPRTGAGPEQWVYSISPQALQDGDIDQLGTTFILPEKHSLGKPTRGLGTGLQPQIESSFWIGAYFHNPGKSWQHFAQVGVDEEWDNKGFVGFKPFYASTLEVSVGGDPTSLRAKNFEGSDSLYQLKETVRVSIKRGDHGVWVLEIGSDIVEVKFPNEEFFRDWMTIALEDLGKKKVPRDVWNGSVYGCTKPYYRLQESRNLRIWRHAQIQINWNAPPRYIGIKTERSLWRKWFGYPPEKIFFGDIGKPQRWGSVW